MLGLWRCLKLLIKSCISQLSGFSELKIRWDFTCQGLFTYYLCARSCFGCSVLNVYYYRPTVVMSYSQVIKSQAHLIDKRRVFSSEMKDDNPLDSIVSKVKIVQLPPNVCIQLLYFLIYCFLFIKLCAHNLLESLYIRLLYSWYFAYYWCNFNWLILQVDLADKEKALSSYDLYYDMQYSKPVTFTTLHKGQYLYKNLSKLNP